MLSYESFRHAQGDQVNQLHFIQSYVRFLVSGGMPIEPGVRVELAGDARKRRVPAGHLTLADDGLVAAQFGFWWENMWDILESVSTGDHRNLPTARVLADRMVALGGTPEMSSFRAEEMTELVAGLDLYRCAEADRLSAVEVVEEYFAPRLVEVELRFQGRGARYPSRPRTDGGDPHESLLAGHCRKALERHRAGTEATVDQIYLAVVGRLESAAGSGSDPLGVAYRELIRAYNANHPGAEVDELHRGA